MAECLTMEFDLTLLIDFLAATSLAKMGSVWVGARVARIHSRSARDVAIALDCRGGPGIVLATVAASAGLINQEFFATLVITALLTSQLSGWWLARSPERIAVLPLRRPQRQIPPVTDGGSHPASEAYHPIKRGTDKI